MSGAVSNVRCTYRDALRRLIAAASLELDAEWDTERRTCERMGEDYDDLVPLADEAMKLRDALFAHRMESEFDDRLDHADSLRELLEDR